MLLIKKLLYWIILGCLTAVLAIGCGASNQTISTPTLSETCRTINHDAGTTEICDVPKTIVSLSAHVLDLLLALDQQPAAYVTPVSLHRGDTFDNPAQQIPYLGHKITTQPLNLGSAQEPSIERLTALEPDLILGETRNADEYKLLSQVAPTLLLADRTVPGQWQEHLTMIANALGQSEKADAIIQDYQVTIEQARLDLADVTAAHPNILLLGGNRLEEGFYVIQANSYLGNLLETVGFTIVSPPLPTGTPNAPVSLEALPDMNSADSIIILGFNTDLNDPTIKQAMAAGEQSIEEITADHQIKAIQQSWQENAIAQSLTASQENRIYFATYAKWNGLNGPTGNELVLEQLIQFFAE